MTVQNMKGDRHILVRDVPSDVDNVLNTIASLKGVPKWTIIREALIEYVRNHRNDVTKLAKARIGPTKP